MLGYMKLESKFCAGTSKYGSFPNIASATKACNEDANCGYIYDAYCDNDGTFKLCLSDGLVLESSKGHCLYGRVGIVITRNWSYIE